MAEVKACSENFDPERLQPIVVAGDTFKAVLSAECIPEQYKKAPIGFLFPIGFRDILKWVLPDYLRRGISSYTVIGPHGVPVSFWMSVSTSAA